MIALQPILGDGVQQTSLVQFDDVWRYWGRGRRRWPVLRGIDLRVAPGSAICIGGRNGAGKTTLLRIATGVLAPSRGTVAVNGILGERNWREYHRAIGFLSAGDRGLYARFSVRSHLDYGAKLGFVPRAQRAQAVDAMMESFGLADIAGRRADRLSQGQRQRLRLALTLVHGPKVLLLDEPRNSLDDEGLEMLSSAVASVLASRGAVIWCCPIGEDQPIRFDRNLHIENGLLTSA